MTKKYLILSSGSEIISKAYSHSNNENNLFVDPVKINGLFILLRKFIARYRIFIINKAVLYGLLKNKGKVDKVVIFDSILWENNIDIVRKIFPETPIVYYYWNYIDHRHNVELVLRYCDEVFSFDQIQAQKYSLKHEDAFGCLPMQTYDQNTYDLSFIGVNKGRKNTLEHFALLFKSKNLRYLIYLLVESEGIKSPHITCSLNSLSYSENLAVVGKSRCLIELPQNQQSGLTVRVQEAILFKKKLITTNELIKNADFYHPSNIHVINPDNFNIDDVCDFLKLDYQELDQDVYFKYTFDGWIKRVLEQEN